MLQKWVQVRLLGKLGKLFFRSERMLIRTPIDAIRLICANFPDFSQYIRDSESRGAFYRVVSGNPLGRSEDELELPCDETLIIAEVDQGAGAFGKILLGAALLGASFFMPATIGIFGATISSFAVGAIGIGLILNGVSEMLAPKAKAQKDQTNLSSNSFGNTAQAATQARPVPLMYGYGMAFDPPIISQGVTVARLPAS